MSLVSINPSSVQGPDLAWAVKPSFLVTRHVPEVKRARRTSFLPSTVIPAMTSAVRASPRLTPARRGRSAETDRPAAIFRERARDLAAQSPEAEWDPIRTLQEK